MGVIIENMAPCNTRVISLKAIGKYVHQSYVLNQKGAAILCEGINLIGQLPSKAGLKQTQKSVTTKENTQQ